jgi:hypothetical protein
MISQDQTDHNSTQYEKTQNVTMEVAVSCNDVWMKQPDKQWSPRFSRLLAQPGGGVLHSFIHRNHPAELEEANLKSLLAVYNACIPRTHFLPILFDQQYNNLSGCGPHVSESLLEIRNYADALKSKEDVQRSLPGISLMLLTGETQLKR